MKSVILRLSPWRSARSLPLARWWMGVVIFAVALTFPMSVPVRAQDQELQGLATQLAQKITKSGKKTVAVVDFTDLRGNVTELGRFLAEELSVSLSQRANGFTVIDRTYLNVILREHKLDTSGLIDPATASKLGEITGVQGLVTGTVVPLGDNVSLSVKVLDATTEAIIAATIIQIPRTEAINALLKTNISTGGTNSSSVEGSGTRPSGQQGQTLSGGSGRQEKTTATVHQGDFDITVRSCTRDGEGVECTGTVTDSTGRPMEFQLADGYLLDNLGNQYSREGSFLNYNSFQLRLGTSGDTQDLEPNSQSTSGLSLGP